MTRDSEQGTGVPTPLLSSAGIPHQSCTFLLQELNSALESLPHQHPGGSHPQISQRHTSGTHLPARRGPTTSMPTYPSMPAQLSTPGFPHVPLLIASPSAIYKAETMYAYSSLSPPCGSPATPLADPTPWPSLTTDPPQDLPKP